VQDWLLTSHWTLQESIVIRRHRAPAVLALIAPLFPLTTGAQVPAPRTPTDTAATLDAYAAKAVRDWQVPGLAISVVKDGRVVFAKGYGVRELGRPAPVDTQTLFAVGSTTKAMTAAALAMLVDEGKVRWDDPVTRYLPWFQTGDPYVTRELTVRDLLTHRGGLGNADYLWYESEVPAADVRRRVRFLRPAYSLRSGFIYQNVMYAVAGDVVEAASGLPWEEFVRRRIFAPLAMTRTVATLRETQTRDNVASPHDRIEATIRPIRNASVDPVAPAGSIWSSVADMAKWMRFMLDSARAADGRQLLKPATWAELLKPQTIVTPQGFYPTARLTRPHWTTYALGWFQHDYNGRAVSFHTGSIDGMVAIIGLIPDERLGVYVLANLDHAEVRHALMYTVFDLWSPDAPGTGRGARGGYPPKVGAAPQAGGAAREWSAELLKLYAGLQAQSDSARARQEAQRIAGTRPTLPLERYAGTYADSLYGAVTVTLERGQLVLRRGARSGVLEHWHYDTFRARWANAWQGTSMATFVIGPRGVADRLEIAGTTLRRTEGSTSDAR
jgi:CubicO group peptidase (beta-lactamase class C family)